MLLMLPLTAAAAAGAVVAAVANRFLALLSHARGREQGNTAF